MNPLPFIKIVLYSLIFSLNQDPVRSFGMRRVSVVWVWGVCHNKKNVCNTDNLATSHNDLCDGVTQNKKEMNG